ncbi:protein MAO HUZI 4, chloroplastic-like [Capsicum annuum]
MFAGKYWLHRSVHSNMIICTNCMVGILTISSILQPGIAKMFPTRQVYHDVLENDIETRHSVSLCLLFCPVGILTHSIAKALTSSPEKRECRTH